MYRYPVKAYQPNSPLPPQTPCQLPVHMTSPLSQTVTHQPYQQPPPQFMKMQPQQAPPPPPPSQSQMVNKMAMHNGVGPSYHLNMNDMSHKTSPNHIQQHPSVLHSPSSSSSSFLLPQQSPLLSPRIKAQPNETAPQPPPPRPINEQAPPAVDDDNNSVYLTIDLPADAAELLKKFATNDDDIIKNLGILAVQMDKEEPILLKKRIVKDDRIEQPTPSGSSANEKTTAGSKKRRKTIHQLTSSDGADPARSGASDPVKPPEDSAKTAHSNRKKKGADLTLPSAGMLNGENSNSSINRSMENLSSKIPTPTTTPKPNFNEQQPLITSPSPLLSPSMPKTSPTVPPQMMPHHVRGGPVMSNNSNVPPPMSPYNNHMLPMQQQQPHQGPHGVMTPMQNNLNETVAHHPSTPSHSNNFTSPHHLQHQQQHHSNHPYQQPQPMGMYGSPHPSSPSTMGPTPFHPHHYGQQTPPPPKSPMQPPSTMHQQQQHGAMYSSPHHNQAYAAPTQYGQGYNMHQAGGVSSSNTINIQVQVQPYSQHMGYQAQHPGMSQQGGNGGANPHMYNQQAPSHQQQYQMKPTVQMNMSMNDVSGGMAPNSMAYQQQQQQQHSQPQGQYMNSAAKMQPANSHMYSSPDQFRMPSPMLANLLSTEVQSLNPQMSQQGVYSKMPPNSPQPYNMRPNQMGAYPPPQNDISNQMMGSEDYKQIYQLRQQILVSQNNGPVMPQSSGQMMMSQKPESSENAAVAASAGTTPTKKRRTPADPNKPKTKRTKSTTTVSSLVQNMAEAAGKQNESAESRNVDAQASTHVEPTRAQNEDKTVNEPKTTFTTAAAYQPNPSADQPTSSSSNNNFGDQSVSSEPRQSTGYSSTPNNTTTSFPQYETSSNHSPSLFINQKLFESADKPSSSKVEVKLDFNKAPGELESSDSSDLISAYSGGKFGSAEPGSKLDYHHHHHLSTDARLSGSMAPVSSLSIASSLPSSSSSASSSSSELEMDDLISKTAHPNENNIQSLVI